MRSFPPTEVSGVYGGSNGNCSGASGCGGSNGNCNIKSDPPTPMPDKQP